MGSHGLPVQDSRLSGQIIHKKGESFMETIGVYAMGLNGVLIKKIEYGINDSVIYTWSHEEDKGNARRHRAIIRQTKSGRSFFVAGRIRVYLDGCMKVGC